MSDRFEVVVIGLGRVGLACATWLAASGIAVCGVEPNDARRADIAAGRADAEEPGLRELILRAQATGALSMRASLDARAPVYLIATPTRAPRAGDDGLETLRQVMGALLPQLQPGALIIVESTLSPGATRREVAGAVEAAGLHPGEQVAIACCPERIMPGRALAELSDQARIIGGLTPSCASRAAALYQRAGARGKLHTTSLELAEAAKLAENLFRDVNIGLANALADWAERAQLDADALIRLANTHPRVALHRPGAGVGGHCLPIAGPLLHARAPLPAWLTAQREDAAAQPARLADQISAALPHGARVALLGVTYKADVSDARHSPALAMCARWAQTRPDLELRAHDPTAPKLDMPLWPLHEALSGADAAVLTVAHQALIDLDLGALAATMRGRTLYDLCRALNADEALRAGLLYVGRGAPARAL